MQEMVSGMNLSLKKRQERCFAWVFQYFSSFSIPKSVIKCLWQLILPLESAHNCPLVLHSHSLPLYKSALDISPHMHMHSSFPQRLRSLTTLFLTDPQNFPLSAPKLHQHPNSNESTTNLWCQQCPQYQTLCKYPSLSSQNSFSASWILTCRI